MKVLIVDDNAENLYLLEKLLTGNGYAVTEKRDGREALEHLKQQPADLIISDILMPKMDGFQLCREVKADAALKNIPFVFYTATYTAEKDREFALSLGASRFIVKPADPGEFMGIIREVLASGEAGTIEVPEPSLDRDRDYLREYSTRVTNKLEKKISQFEGSERRYRNLFTSMRDAVIIANLDRIIVDANQPALRSIFGYELGEVLERSTSMLYADEQEFERTGREIFNRSAPSDSRIIEAKFRRKDGTVFHGEMAALKLVGDDGAPTGNIGIIHDITERKRTEQFIQDIFQSMGEGLAVIGPDFRIRTANPAYAQMGGLTMEQVKNMTCFEAAHHRQAPCDEDGCLCPVRESFRTGAPSATVHQHGSGATGFSDVEVRSYPLKDASGAVTAVIEILRDVTTEKKLEAQLRQAQKMEAVGQLAGGVAHDFNNILTAIIGYANLLAMKLAADDPLRSNVDEILSASERAARLTHSLLAFSRKQILNPRAVDLNETVREVENLLRRLIGEDVELATIPSDRPLTIMADPGQISQALMNLATNARDAMPNGGLFSIGTTMMELDANSAQVHGLEKPGAYAVLQVSDTGGGMDEQTRTKIFEPFFTTKETGKGTGLGLAMVYGIVKQHNGQISVYSEPGKGTRFTVYLPLIDAEVRRDQPKESIADLSGTETVLLAEDDDAVRSMTRTVLTEFGYTVIEARDGEEAIALFSEQPGVIDLVLLDVIMPKKNGREVHVEMQRLRPGVKALFMSGYTADIIHRRGLIEKGLPFVSKPVTPTELLRKVRETLAG